MRIVFASILSVLVFISAARAEDAKFYADVYSMVKDEYIGEVDIKKLAEDGVNGLAKINDKIKIANGDKSISLYYNGKMIKTIVKPKDKNNAKDWAVFTKKMIDAAVSASPDIKAKDFEMSEYILIGMVEGLDKDTKYFPYFEVAGNKSVINKEQHYFTDRMIDGKILYIKPGRINLYTRDMILESFDKNQTFEALIVDLRGNPGGLLSEAVSVVKIFLDGGIIASSKARKDGVMTYYTVDENNESLIGDKKVVVIVDADTASSAEVLASSLKEQSIATVIGSKTKGKGTVQKLIPLSNNGELALTIANFYTPSGRSVNGIGIRPSICLEGLNDNDDAKSIVDDDKYKNKECTKESRIGYDIDIDVAAELLKK